MQEPPMRKDTVRLNGVFRDRLQNFLNAANKVLPGWEIRLIETVRTVDRQKWLKATSTKTHWKTDKDGVLLLSLHQYGVAADIGIFSRRDGHYITGTQAYIDLYRAVNPSEYGLETLIPAEYAHLQIATGYVYVKQHNLKGAV
jgi:hypothetical protein